MDGDIDRVEMYVRRSVLAMIVQAAVTIAININYIYSAWGISKISRNSTAGGPYSLHVKETQDDGRDPLVSKIHMVMASLPISSLHIS